MSSFICSAEHFNAIDHNLQRLINNDDFFISYSLKNVLPYWYDKRLYTFNAIEKEITDILNTIKDLQVLCVTLQYKDHYKGNLDVEIQECKTFVRTKTEVKNLTVLGLYNALRCVDYQIEIDHLKDIRPLTEEEQNALFFLKEIIKDLAVYIIMKLPDDLTNTWEVH